MPSHFPAPSPPSSPEVERAMVEHELGLFDAVFQAQGNELLSAMEKALLRTYLLAKVRGLLNGATA